MDEGKIKVKNVKKAVDILNCFIEKENLGVTEISEKLGFTKSNVYDILTTLTALDILGQDEESEKYYLSVGILGLSQALGQRFSFRHTAMGFMKDIANEFHEIVNLSVPSGRSVFYINMTLPSEEGYYKSRRLTSFTMPMHCTASGKCMLAFMPRKKVLEYLSGGLEAVTPATITDDVALLQELGKIRESGYGVADAEHDLNEMCLAVPLISGENRLLGAMSVSGPKADFSEEKAAGILKKLRAAADEIHRLC